MLLQETLDNLELVFWKETVSHNDRYIDLLTETRKTLKAFCHYYEKVIQTAYADFILICRF